MNYSKLLAEEYGTVDWREAEFQAGKHRLHPNAYMRSVYNRLIELGEAVACQACGGKGWTPTHNDDGIPCSSCYGRGCKKILYGKNVGVIPRDVVDKFYNYRTPQWVAENYQYIVEAWNHCSRGREPYGTGTIHPEHFAYLYRFFGAEFINLFVRPQWHMEGYIRGKIAVALVKRREIKMAVRWMRAPKVMVDTCGNLSMGDIKRLLKAPAEIRHMVGKRHLIKDEDGCFKDKINWESIAEEMKHPDCNTERFLPKRTIWKKIHKFIPKDSGLISNVDKENIQNFDKKLYMRAYKRFYNSNTQLHDEDRWYDGDSSYSDTMNAEDAVHLAVKVQAMLTTGNWTQLLNYMNKRRHISDHDTLSCLPTVWDKTFGEYLMAHKETDITALSVIAAGWHKIDDEERKLPVKELVSAIRMKKYSDVQDPSLAAEAAHWGCSEYAYEQIQRRALSYQKIFDPESGMAPAESIPAVEMKVGKYTMRKLDRHDPKGLFLGQYTDCCQHPDGAGSSCAWHGYAHPNGAFFVVEDDKDRIVAQSWTWRRGDAVIFDNVEVLGSNWDEDRVETLFKLYEGIAQKMQGNLCIKAVLLGTGYDDSGILSRLKQSTNLVRWPKHIYSDAKRDQRLLAGIAVGTEDDLWIRSAKGSTWKNRKTGEIYHKDSVAVFDDIRDLLINNQCELASDTCAAEPTSLNGERVVPSPDPEDAIPSMPDFMDDVEEIPF